MGAFYGHAGLAMIEDIERVMINVLAVVSVHTKPRRYPRKAPTVLNNVIRALPMNTVLTAQNHHVLRIQVMKKRADKKQATG